MVSKMSVLRTTLFKCQIIRISGLLDGGLKEFCCTLLPFRMYSTVNNIYSPRNRPYYLLGKNDGWVPEWVWIWQRG
jgi:hypothetical protein